MLSLRRFTKLTSYRCFLTLKIAYLQSKNLMLSIRSCALVAFKSMLVKLIESSSPDLMNMVQKLSSQCASTFSAFSDHIILFALPDAATDTTTFSKELHLQSAVINNIIILEKNDKGINFNFLMHIIFRKWHLKLSLA